MASRQTLEVVDRDGIPELRNTNWPEWSYKMKQTLILYDLWDYVDMEVSLSTTNTNEYTVEDQEKLKMAAKAKARILMKVPHNYMGVIKGCQTAKQIWDKLESLYKQKSLARTTHLLKAFHNVRMEDKESTDDYITRVSSLASELEDNGREVDETAICIAVLNGLPSRYSTIIHVIENYNQVLSIENVRNSLLRFESTESNGAAMVAPSKNKTKKSRPYCAYCKRPGHHRSDCRRLKNKAQKGNIGHNFDQHGVSQPQEHTKTDDMPIGHCLTAIARPTQKQPPTSGLRAQANKSSANFASLGSNSSTNDAWIVDSGASYHMTGDPTLIDPASRTPAYVTVTCANGTQLTSEFKGNTKLITASSTPVQLTNVYYVPGFTHNLLSVQAAMSTGAEFHFVKGACRIVCPNGIIETVPTEDQVFALLVTAQKWHERLGHASAPRLKLLGLPHKLEGPCEPCIQAKQTAQPFYPSDYNHEPLDLIYTDLVGPVPETPGGQTYYLSMYDQASKASQVFLLPNKSSAAGALMEGINTFEKIAKPGYRVKAIRSDLGGEFQSSQLQNFLKDHGITHETTAGYTPQQNVAERLHRTLHDSARAMLIRAKLPESLWGEAVRCANYVRNRTPVSLSADGRTPLEIFTGSAPNLHRLRTFGCDAWVLIPPEKRKNKFSAWSVRGTFIGYQNSSTYRILVDSKVILSRNVTFVEDKFSGQSISVTAIEASQGPYETLT